MKKLSLIIIALAACSSPPDGPSTRASASVTAGCTMDCSAWGQSFSIQDGMNVFYAACVSGRCGTWIVAPGTSSCDQECAQRIAPSLACVQAQVELDDESSGDGRFYPIACSLDPASVADADDGSSGLPAPWPGNYDFVEGGQYCFCG